MFAINYYTSMHVDEGDDDTFGNAFKVVMFAVSLLVLEKANFNGANKHQDCKGLLP